MSGPTSSGSWPILPVSSSKFLATEADERNSRFSPNGAWLAYVSNESGQDEVYIRPYPRANGGLRRISEGGGTSPAWSAEGDEIYYLDPSGNMMAVAVEPGSGSFTAGMPRELFSNSFRNDGQQANVSIYNVYPDGFLRVSLPQQASGSSPRINIVLNWFEELKARLPSP